MLIGIDANEANLTQNRVGVNQYAFDLLWAIYLQNFPHNFVIYLKTPPGSDLPAIRPNWSYRVIPFPKLWTQTRLPWDLYTHSPRPDVFFSMTHYAPRYSPIPTIVAIMDLGFLQTPEQFTTKDFTQLKKWTEYSVKQAKKIIAISEHTKQDIVRVYNRQPSDITVTYLGYDSSHFVPTKNSRTPSRYGINKPYLLFLGSLRPSKNIERLIKAYHKLNPKHLLVIAGKKGWLYESIFSLVKELNLNNRVIFPGFVAESDVPALMTEASLFVMPSLYEGFGIPALEAMACGTPVVVSRVASLPEVVGDAGIYVDPQDVDSIAHGIESGLGPNRSKFVKLGLSRVKLFSWTETAHKTMAVLESAAIK